MSIKPQIKLLFFIAAAVQAGADNARFGRQDYPNRHLPAGGGISITAGGIGPASPATSANGTSLVSASIGFNAGTPVGFVSSGQGSLDAQEYYRQRSNTHLGNGAKYKYIDNQTGILDNGGGAWDIRFEGAVNEDDPNYDEAELLSALEAARVAISIDPYDVRLTNGKSSYALLIQSLYEMTVPKTFAANAWLAEAARWRVKPELAKTTDDRLEALAKARNLYKEAADQLLKLLADPVESNYTGNYLPAPAWSGASAAGHADEVDALFTAFATALAARTGLEESYFQTRFLNEFVDPLTGNFDPTAMAVELSAIIREIEMQSVAATALRHLPGFPFSDLKEVSAGISRLRSRKEAIERQLLVFALGKDRNNTFSYAAYSPHFVPFLYAQGAFASRLSFDNLINFAEELTGTGGNTPTAAFRLEAEAATAIDARLDTQTKLDQMLAEVKSQYERELADLCGTVRNGNGPIVPDIIHYILPPEERPARVTNGAIYNQWLTIEEAENRVLAAIRATEEVAAEAAIIQEGAAERAQSDARIATLILDTGEQIVVQDNMAKDVRQQAIQKEADLREARLKKKSWFSKIGKALVFTAAAVLAPVSGGASLAGAALATGAWTAAHTAAAITAGSSLVQEAISLKEASDNANADAQLVRDVAGIQKQQLEDLQEIENAKTRIRAMEQAQIQLERTFQEESRTRERLRTLFVKVERLKLDEIYARQQLRRAELELANLIGRVDYVQQEFRKALVMTMRNPLNRPDYRLAQDYKVREAERAFRFAQEWVYLSAKAAQYRFMRPNQFEDAGLFVQRAVRATHASELASIISELKAVKASFYGSTAGNAPVRRVVLSLRDFLIQNNRVTRDTEGLPLAIPAPSYLPLPLQNSADSAAASKREWTAWLRRNLDLSNPNRPILRLSFSTSAEPTYRQRQNPLFFTDQYGHFIVHDPISSPDAKGVFINVRGRQLSSQIQSLSSSLFQDGTTAVPFRSFNAAAGTPRFRFWSLPRRPGSPPVYINQDPNALFDNSARAGTEEFHERSPIAESWTLVFDSLDGDNFTLLDQFLDNIEDIEICMAVRGFTQN